MNTCPFSIELDGISKRFGGVTALNSVSFGICSGEVHALVGENGAGKSTLMKLLAGIYPPDEGRIMVDGRNVQLNNPRAARDHGISIVFQELNLFPHRSIAANVFANRELTTFGGVVRRRAMREATRTMLSDLAVPLSPDEIVARLTMSERQLVEIARTLGHHSRIVILDEPNSALNEQESARLFQVIRRLRAGGITIVYVSHRLEEVFAIADRITVLRDGRYQGTWTRSEATIPGIVEAMIGRRLENAFPSRKPPGEKNDVRLQIRDLCASGLGPITFSARAGEIVAFAGLEGAGVDALFDALFGLEPIHSGEVSAGPSAAGLPPSPQAAISAGWALVPKSRRDQGLMMDWPVARNATLLILNQLLNRLGLINRRAVHQRTNQYLKQFAISNAAPEFKVVALSGGNQQKVLLAKWLATGPGILILNDPTRGVDVAAKADIYDLCLDLAAKGMTILMTSSEADEMLGLADRLMVLSKGRIVQEFRRGAVNKAQLIQAMTGSAAASSLTTQTQGAE